MNKEKFSAELVAEEISPYRGGFASVDTDGDVLKVRKLDGPGEGGALIIVGGPWPFDRPGIKQGRCEACNGFLSLAPSTCEVRAANPDAPVICADCFVVLLNDPEADGLDVSATTAFAKRKIRKMRSRWERTA